MFKDPCALAVMPEGRFKNLTYSVDDDPICDTLYVRLTGNDEWRGNYQTLEWLETLRTRTHAEDEHA